MKNIRARIERNLFFGPKTGKLFLPLWRAARVVPNKIVCISYEGRYHADNPALIVDQMLAMRPDLDVAWLVNGNWPLQPIDRIRPVPLFSWRALYELSTARVWMNNMRMQYFVPKKRNQFYVQTWHSGVGPKMVENDVIDTLPPEYVARAKKDAEYSDLMISGSRFFTELCRRAFFFDGEVLECGTPRMDILFHQDTIDANALRARHGLSGGETVVLYAPTFRRDLWTQPCIEDFSALSRAFSERTGKPVKFLLKFHPNVAGLFRDRQWGPDVIDVTSHPDIQDLYPVSDFLLTDYSSTMLEFALLGKPVFLYMADYEDYLRERKLYFRPEELPFRVSFSFPELLESVRKKETPDEAGKVERFFERIGMHETGKAAQLAAERILREME